MRSLKVAFIAALVGLGASGCQTGAAFQEDPGGNEKVYLVVKNESVDGMAIYAVSEGVSTRVGTVSGFQTRGFVLEPYLFQVSHSRVDGAPIGGNGRASTGDIIVNRGQTVEFTIRQSLNTSTVSIQ